MPTSHAPWTKWAFAVGHVLNDLCASLWFTYLLVYFHFVLEFDNKLAGVVLMIGQIADALSTPFVGLESDKDDNFFLCRYGRRKTWHLIGTICVLGTMPFIFMKCIHCENSSQQAQLVYYGAFVALFQFGWASVQISHLSLIPELADDEHERTGLNALRYAFTVMSNVTIYIIAWATFGVQAGAEEDPAKALIGPEDADSFTRIVLIAVAIGAVFSLIFHIGVKEPPSRRERELLSTQSAELSKSARMRPGDWLKQLSFYKTAAAYMATRLYVNVTQVYVPLYLQDSLNLEARHLAIVPLVMYLSGFGSSFFVRLTNKHFGRKVTFFLGALFGFGACVWILVGTGEDYRKYEVYLVGALSGMCSSTVLITSLSITSDLIGENTESGAFVYGSMSFADKLANGIAILLIQSFHPGKRDCFPVCDSYYKQVLTYACGGFLFFAVLAVFTTQPRQRQINTEPSGLGYGANDAIQPALPRKSTNVETPSHSEEENGQ